MLSVNRGQARLGALVVSLSLVGGVASGCSTTQEKAEKQKARAEHILNARAEREQAQKHKHGKSKQKAKEGKAQ